MAEVLYHYTDFRALDSILSASELRLNNVLNMNDAAEMRFFVTELCRAVETRLTAAGREDRAEAARRLLARELKNEFVYSAYAACFSRYRDDASQWERYGGRGTGVCIGFDRALLERITGGAVSLQNVYYQKDLSGHPLAEVFFRLALRDPMPSADDPALRECLDEAWVASAAFKHPSFANENEVRLVLTPYGQSLFGMQPRYHVTPGRIKKYYPLMLDEMCSRAGISAESLFTELIIGPDSTQSLPILQDYLHSLGFTALAERVTPSACPLKLAGM